ncbi:hypothetical protein [Paenibacillus sp. L3-i20]|uniref:hypothetical protein n=1 Tax=Paenibacillus sp. L3-i20 TaxID=2905833 RepID=UPI001EDD4E97|nr:hypothetical protein [Paenibacillus sp. L3-i20]GKU77767.1 hypothetical protein L3i20_v221640 [Paenibacillus sp. L3-i20]
MDAMISVYEQLVAEEEELLQNIEICEGCISVVFQYISGKEDPQIGESILTAIHTIEKDLQTELLHLKLEKSLLANKIKLLKS